MLPRAVLSRLVRTRSPGRLPLTSMRLAGLSLAAQRRLHLFWSLTSILPAGLIFPALRMRRSTASIALVTRPRAGRLLPVQRQLLARSHGCIVRLGAELPEGTQVRDWVAPTMHPAAVFSPGQRSPRSRSRSLTLRVADFRPVVPPPLRNFSTMMLREEGLRVARLIASSFHPLLPQQVGSSVDSFNHLPQRRA